GRLVGGVGRTDHARGARRAVGVVAGRAARRDQRLPHLLGVGLLQIAAGDLVVVDGAAAAGQHRRGHEHGGGGEHAGQEGLDVVHAPPLSKRRTSAKPRPIAGGCRTPATGAGPTLSAACDTAVRSVAVTGASGVITSDVMRAHALAGLLVVAAGCSDATAVALQVQLADGHPTPAHLGMRVFGPRGLIADRPDVPATLPFSTRLLLPARA